jgi:hypothetical protein
VVAVTNLAPLLSSAGHSWRTPEHVLDLVRMVGPIMLDPCAHQDGLVHAATELRRARGEDGLEADWLALSGGGLVFVNSPYGREIVRWVLRCYALGQLGGECIALLPARTDTFWWQRYVAHPNADAVLFWRGRLTFVGAPAAAPFPSAIAYWGPRPHRFKDVFAPYGALA